MTKADTFSLGLMIYEIMAKSKVTLPNSGCLWHELREGKLAELPTMTSYTNDFKSLIKKMTDPDPIRRPSAADILNLLSQHYLPIEVMLCNTFTEKFHLSSCSNFSNDHRDHQ